MEYYVIIKRYVSKEYLMTWYKDRSLANCLVLGLFISKTRGINSSRQSCSESKHVRNRELYSFGFDEESRTTISVQNKESVTGIWPPQLLWKLEKWWSERGQLEGQRKVTHQGPQSQAGNDYRKLCIWWWPEVTVGQQERSWEETLDTKWKRTWDNLELTSTKLNS